MAVFFPVFFRGFLGVERGWQDAMLEREFRRSVGSLLTDAPYELALGMRNILSTRFP